MGLRKWLLNLDQYGIGFVDNVPKAKDKSEELCKRISYLRNTHYGSFWDFTANMEHGDLAYSTAALPAHTDATYNTDPVGLQYFHVLQHLGTGGKSLYVDGFNIAKQLKEENPWAFNALSTIMISAHAMGSASLHLKPTPELFPILKLDPSTKEIYQIRFNNEDRSPTLMDPNASELFYAALHEIMKLIRKKDNEYWVQLGSKAVIVDNWRVLHGRSSFTGYRRVIGCYIGYDEFQSRLRTLNRIF